MALILFSAVGDDGKPPSARKQFTTEPHPWPSFYFEIGVHKVAQVSLELAL